MGKTIAVLMLVVWMVSPSVRADGRYFRDAAGKTWVPVGLNICFSRTKNGEPPGQALDERRAEFEGWISAFAANGGNYVRLWLGHEFFEVMPEKPGSFDSVRTETLLRVVRLCERLGIRLKLTLESFRTVFPEGQEPKQLYGRFFNRPLYAPYAKSMADFYRSEECFRIYLEKVRYLKSLGLDESPAVWCWELWNEIDATGSSETYGPWSDRMLAELKWLFPKQLTVQNLGSCAYANSYQAYEQMAGVAGNDFMQMHRYLDPGAPRDVCRGPMDVLAAESIRELLELRGDRPAVLAETGAVKANHTGPSELYEKDREGALLHDALFAPFFAGGAGCGQFWHWDSYVARWNLWHHYKRFAKAIEGLDPIAEGFRPFRTETARLRVYGLRGRKTTVLWCRDKSCDWRSELVEGKAAETVMGEKLPFWNRTFRCYLPWEDRVVETSAPALPPFRRSVVVRFPTAGQEESAGPMVPVALTFDDGCRGQLSVAEPMLAARGWKGTFNIVTGWKSGVMSWDEIRELKRRGHEITSHSVTHPRMVTLLEEGKTNEVVRELRESATTIERETGAKPRWFCAPYVQQNAELDRLARQEGMRVMTVPRIPFGGKHPPDKDYGKYIDAQLAKKPKALDFLIHGITVATGGWGPFDDEKDFANFLDAIAERERRGLIRVVPYVEAYEANEIL